MGCFTVAASYGTESGLEGTFYSRPPPLSVPRRAPGQKFTLEEDARLRVLVFRYGMASWKQIAFFMPNRSARQCRERWKNYLIPGLNFSPWTWKDDALLREKFNELGPKWAQIVKFFPGRTDTNCKNRWQQLQTRERRRLQLNPPALPPQDDLTWDDTEDFYDQY